MRMELVIVWPCSGLYVEETWMPKAWHESGSWDQERLYTCFHPCEHGSE